MSTTTGAAKVRPIPKGSTPIRTVRVEDELWEAAQERAAELDEDVSAVIRRGLESYVA